MQNNSSTKRKPRSPKIECICNNCGKHFLLKAGKLHQKEQQEFIYCSRKCYNLYRQGQPRQYKESLGVRFWKRVQKTETCWLWTGCKVGGYGRFFIHSILILAHRFAYQITYGPIPDGKIVCHKCNTPLCVRPDHLYAGTSLDNGLDMVLAGTFIHKLTPDQVIEIRELYAKGDTSLSILSKKFGVNVSSIHAVVQRRTWKYI